MLHHIFRNLWNSRKRNVWILLELIVIAIVCWMVIDPLYGAQNEAYMSRSAEKLVRGLCFNELGVGG